MNKLFKLLPIAVFTLTLSLYANDNNTSIPSNGCAGGKYVMTSTGVVYVPPTPVKSCD